ncbi:MAG: hypothetical protein ACD_87C00310G0001 [uncultured bacterium]|nr:MAG: hypothetical protein ACD_87C00310G0001 [uncultured bacterium]
MVHSCVNGLGERTGNAALEELMVGLHILLGLKTNYQFDKIIPLSELVSELSGVKLANNKPVLGRGNYIRESGIGVDLVMTNPLAMFATAPRLTGRQAEVVLGKKSGKASIAYMLDKLDIRNVSDENVNEILKDVKEKGTGKKGLLTADEFNEIIRRKGLSKKS